MGKDCTDDMITSSANQQMKHLSQLMKRAKERKKEQVFVVEGIKMFQEAPADTVVSVYVSESFLEKPEHPSAPSSPACTTIPTCSLLAPASWAPSSPRRSSTSGSTYNPTLFFPFRSVGGGAVVSVFKGSFARGGRIQGFPDKYARSEARGRFIGKDSTDAEKWHYLA